MRLVADVVTIRDGFLSLGLKEKNRFVLKLHKRLKFKVAQINENY
jgi:hypothetical protein